MDIIVALLMELVKVKLLNYCKILTWLKRVEHYFFKNGNL